MTARNLIIKLSRLCFRDELSRKRYVIRYYNSIAHLHRAFGGNDAYDMFHPKPYQLKNRFIVHEYYRGNALYGISQSLRRYSGYEKELPVGIEHGVYFGDYVDTDLTDPCLPGIVTFSDVRCEHIAKKTQRIAYPIGPYIHYADKCISDDEIRSLKQEFGKTLVVFPGHSIAESRIAGSDGNTLLAVAADLCRQAEFDTVLVCLYYNDYAKLKNRIGIEQPFRTVCMGNRYDSGFLPRLKTLISLADYTASDSVGTHVGYCVYMNKPHWVVPLDDCDDNSRRLIEVEEVRNAFSEYGGITDAQRLVVDKYWGVSKLRSPRELYDYFLSCEKKMKALR